jgi:hypothetical protein
MVSGVLRIGGICAALAWLLCLGCSGQTDRPAQPHDARGQDAAARDTNKPPSNRPTPDAALGMDDGGDAASSNDAMVDASADDAHMADAAVMLAPDEVPPQLIASTPVDADDNVAFDVTPTLTFSEPVVLGVGALEIRQTSPARALAFAAKQSPDGLSIELSLAAPPELPAELTIALGAGITDLAGNPLEPTTVRFAMPIWQRLGAVLNRAPLATATDVRLALDGLGRPVLLSIEDNDVYVSRWQDGAWLDMGAQLNQNATLPSPGAESRAALAIDASGAPFVAFREATSVVVMRWNGSAWQSLGDLVDPVAGGSYAPALAVDSSGKPIVAFDALDPGPKPVVRVRALGGASWQTLATIDAEARGVRLADGGPSEFTLAYQEPGTGIVVERWDGAQLLSMGGGPALAAVSGSFALSTGNTQSPALTAQGQGTLTWLTNSWDAVTQDLGFANSSRAADRALAHAPDASLFTAFSEIAIGQDAARVFVQRRDGSRFQPLGPALNRDRAASATRPSLVVDATGAPLVAWLEKLGSLGPTNVFVSRFNGDATQSPHGLRERPYSPECLATTPLDGSLLTDTACFIDTLGRQPVAGFVPFDVRSPLWTDGAWKRRFVMLPQGTAITYRDPGIWTMPAGTILIKEFAIEGRRGDPSTIRPVETRFLVVRDGSSWDRYSYQWNQAGTAAVLRAQMPAIDIVNFDIEDELSAPTVQKHFFPSRFQCLGCHEAPGTVLGLQTAMINRNLDYGSTVDNQLRAMQQVGLFGNGFAADELALARAMPNPIDTTSSTEARLRAYLHANCSGCHHDGFQGMDLRIQIATLASGLCSKINKGDLNASLIYWRDVLRGNPGYPDSAPMPPLGTLTANPLNETLLTDWILDPANPCP